MSQETLDVQQVNGEPELYVDKVLTKRADLIPAQLDESLLRFEREMEKMTVTFSPNDTRAATISPMMAYIEAHPEQYRQAMYDYGQTWGQLAELGNLDDESEKAIVRLAAQFLEHNRAIFQALAHAAKTADENSPTTTVLGGVMDEKLQAMLTPAQHFFIKCLGAAADKMRAA